MAPVIGVLVTDRLARVVKVEYDAGQEAGVRLEKLASVRYLSEVRAEYWAGRAPVRL